MDKEAVMGNFILAEPQLQNLRMKKLSWNFFTGGASTPKFMYIEVFMDSFLLAEHQLQK